MPDGKNPLSSLILTPEGLFGTALQGGVNNAGIAYNVTTDEGEVKENTIYNFGSAPFDIISPTIGFLPAYGESHCTGDDGTSDADLNSTEKDKDDNDLLALFGADAGGA